MGLVLRQVSIESLFCIYDLPWQPDEPAIWSWHLWVSLHTTMPAPIIKIAVVGPLGVSELYSLISGSACFSFRVVKVPSSISPRKHVRVSQNFIFPPFLFGNYRPLILAQCWFFPRRILEHEAPLTTKGRSQNWNVQIFDCSGDQK